MIEKPEASISGEFFDIYTLQFHPKSDSTLGYIFAVIGHPFVKVYKITNEEKLIEIRNFNYDPQTEAFYSLTWCSSDYRFEYNVLACAGESGNVYCISPYSVEGDFFLPVHRK
jgi:hypothetical protein